MRRFSGQTIGPKMHKHTDDSNVDDDVYEVATCLRGTAPLRGPRPFDDAGGGPDGHAGPADDAGHGSEDQHGAAQQEPAPQRQAAVSGEPRKINKHPWTTVRAQEHNAIAMTIPATTTRVRNGLACNDTGCRKGFRRGWVQRHLGSGGRPASHDKNTNPTSSR